MISEPKVNTDQARDGQDDLEPAARATHTATHTATHMVTGEAQVREDGLDARKQRLISEVEQSVEVYERPDKPLDDAISGQQDEEKDVFDGLIKQNVTLDRQKRKVTEQLQEYSAQNEVLKVEVETQKEHCAELEAKVKAMETDIKGLVIAARKQGMKKKTSSLSTDAVQDQGTENNNKSNDTEKDWNKPEQKRIRELQFRLLRMTTDMEEKDRLKEVMEKDSEELRSYVGELEALVEPNKVEEIKARRKETREETGRKEDRANVVKQSGGATNSKICVIM